MESNSNPRGRVSKKRKREGQKQEDAYLQKSTNLIAKARDCRAHGYQGLNECIDLLTEAIDTMSGVYDKTNERDCSLLAKAYCLRALCTQDAQNSKFDFEDIHRAIHLWLSVPMTSLVDNNTYTLLYHVGDMLSLKGRMDFHNDIYELMMRYCKCKNIRIKKDLLVRLLTTKSTSHGLCTAHVNDALISSTASEHYQSNTVNFWKSCMKKSRFLKLSIEQWFSGTGHSRKTIDDIHKAMASPMMKRCNQNSFICSNLYYELSETLISKGAMIEALFYANKAFVVRKKAHDDNFTSVEGLDKVKTMQDKSVATSAWSDYDRHSSGQAYLITPWNVLRCFLESLLQVSTILEIVGDGVEAQLKSHYGKSLSDSKGLPIFSVSFSNLLGKIHIKQQCWAQAEEELHTATDILASSSGCISCLNCKILLEAETAQQRGDLCKSQSDDAIKAESFYESAIKNLKCIKLRSCVSNPDETVLKDVIDMKWERARRQRLIMLSIKIGESLWCRGKTEEANEKLSDAISMLVNQATFQTTKSTSSFSLLKELTERNKTGGMFAVEQATVLYTICWLTLRTDEERKQSCDMFNLSMPAIVSGLKLSLLGCREVPELWQKVTRLLALLYFYSLADSSRSSLSSRQWACFFHQASLGASINCRLFSRRLEKQNDHNTMDGSSSLSLHRLVSESVLDIEEFISNFYKGLPPATIVCLSILDGDYASWFRSILPGETTATQLVMISRLNSDGEPHISIWPVASILPDAEEERTSNTVDKILSELGAFTEEFVIGTKNFEDDQYDEWIDKLEDRFCNFLKNTRKTWFGGPRQKLMLLGERINDGSKFIGRDYADRKPVILVLDLEVLMFPWESLPILRDQEVYRMLSVASIAYTIDHHHSQQGKGGEGCSVFPVMDPLKAYYFVDPRSPGTGNPDVNALTDFLRKQFKKTYQGGTRSSPDVDKLLKALKEHHLYIYIGHGSGRQYIPDHMVEDLECCAAAMLMGCKSGCLRWKGPYIPFGTPLSYLLAGSPIVISNLWSVDNNILQITKTMLDQCIEARTGPCVKCIKSSKTAFSCKHKQRIGSFMGKARAGAYLSNIVGAACVCYGVPTYIFRGDL